MNKTKTCNDKLTIIDKWDDYFNCLICNDRINIKNCWKVIIDNKGYLNVICCSDFCDIEYNHNFETHYHNWKILKTDYDKNCCSKTKENNE